MSAPPPSHKDAPQVLRYAFDDATGRLRVDAVAVLGPGGISAADGDNVAISDGTDTLLVNPDGSINTSIAGEVQIEINAADGDNIAINDGTDTMEVNSDGSINVNITNTHNITNTFNEVTSVVSGITTLIVAYTAISPVKIQKIAFSGTNIAMYEMLVNASLQDKSYTYFGNLNGTFDFPEGLNISIGDVIELQVTHLRPTTGDFNGRIQVME
jgi:hypothetical protein